MWGSERAAAQNVEGGLQLGVASSTMVSDSAEAGYRTGLVGGAFLELDATNAVSTRIEVRYVMSGATLGSATLALDNVQVPVLLKFDVGGSGVGRTLFVGASIAGRVSSEMRGPVGTTELTNTRAWELGWLAGAGIELDLGGQRLLVDGRYSRGVTGIFNNGGDKIQTLSLSVGWSLF
jgi:hypothetical protein